MKKNAFNFALFTLILFSAAPVFALPTLQLDISGGIYDSTTETIVSTSGIFTLYALLNGDYSGQTHYISAAVLPQTDTPDGLGSFVFDGQVINIDTMSYGTPEVNGVNLPTHGVFPTLYTEFAFTFNENDTVGPYNTQDEPGGFDAYMGESGAYYAAFDVDLNGLLAGTAIHFDLYTGTVRGANDNPGIEFAPFSHDAQGSSEPVPEPATLILLGSGMLGIAGFSKTMLHRSKVSQYKF